MDTQDIFVWYVVILTGVAILMAWVTLRANARASAIDDRLKRLIGSLEALSEVMRRLEATTKTSLQSSGERLPVAAVLEIRETYEELVKLQRDQNDARNSDLKAIYDEHVRYLRSELTTARSHSDTRAGLVAIHEQHLKLIELVKELLARLAV